MLKHEFPKHKVVSSKASREGMCYQAAGGAEIPNEGQTVLESITENGTRMPSLVVQAAPVGVNIHSVRKLCKGGAKVEFEDKEGTITLKCGTKVPFRIRHGIYMVKLFVQPPAGSGMPGFMRSGA